MESTALEVLSSQDITEKLPGSPNAAEAISDRSVVVFAQTTNRVSLPFVNAAPSVSTGKFSAAVGDSHKYIWLEFGGLFLLV